MLPNNRQFSRQVLHKGLSSFAKNTTLNKYVGDEDIKALKNEHLIVNKTLASLYTHRKDLLLKSSKKQGHNVALQPGNIVMLAPPTKKLDKPRATVCRGCLRY